AEAAVQPTGERREDALAAAGKLLRTGDPAGKLRQLIDDGLAENGGGLTWEKASRRGSVRTRASGRATSRLPSRAGRSSWRPRTAAPRRRRSAASVRTTRTPRTRTAPTTASTTRWTPSGSRTA